MSKVKRKQQATRLEERIWAVLMVDGNNGIRKGTLAFKMATLEGKPAMAFTGRAPKMAVRPLRDDDFVELNTAIEVLESFLETLRSDAEADLILPALRRHLKVSRKRTKRSPSAP